MFHIDWEPYNGMATRPWLMFFAQIIGILLWAAVIVLEAIACYTPASEETTILVETGFVSYTVDGRELYLHTPGGERYKINVYQYYDGIFDDPATLCEGNPYRIWVNDHGYIKAMEDAQGQQYITFDSEREAYRRSNIGANALLLALLLFSVALFVLSLVVSKNSEWYPAWLVKILFANASEFWSK